MKKTYFSLFLLLFFILTGTLVAALQSVPAYPTAPECSYHADRTYHGLWNDELGCHYDHHHGNNPHDLDDVLGTEYYEIAGGEISYPWQTFSAIGTENNLKHEGYIWIVRKNLVYPARGNSGVITDFRAQVHQLADGHDAPIRYHSGAIEFRVCPRPADPVQNGCGTAFLGGWQDTGDLQVDRNTVIDEPGSGNRVKQHSSTTPGAVWYPSSQVVEQGQQGLFRISVTTHDQWDYTSAHNPSQYNDYICYPNPTCRLNGTVFRPHLILLDVPQQFENVLDPDDNNIVDNYEGYLNRFGTIVYNCVEVGLDCVPVKLINIRTDISYNYSDIDSGQDYDVYFCSGTPCTATSRGARPANWMRPVP